jgi:Ca-activated chloride channel family protein
MERKVIIILMIPFLLYWHWFKPAAKKNLEGIKAYQEGKYEEALEKFLNAKGIDVDLAALKNNTANAKGINADLAALKNNAASALYQMKKYKEALEEFSQIDPAKTNIPKAEFYYNLGNSLYRLKQFDKAVESYKKSIIENSDDMDAKRNYELALKKLQEQKDKQKKDKKQDKEQENQQQQQEKEKQHQNIMQYLNQNEKEQMEKEKRKVVLIRKEKDW